MSLERNKLKALVAGMDLDGICRWVDEVVAFAKAEAVAPASAPVDVVTDAARYRLLLALIDELAAKRYNGGALDGYTVNTFLDDVRELREAPVVEGEG